MDNKHDGKSTLLITVTVAVSFIFLYLDDYDLAIYVLLLAILNTIFLQK